jgi:hypothetical protein
MSRYTRLCSFCCLLMLCCALSSIAACQESRRPSRYLIPEGYVGWVNIYFEVKDAPPLSMEEDHYLFKLPASGELQTSSRMASGVAKDDYYYYDDASNKVRRLESTGWDGGGMIWAESFGDGEKGGNNLRFFIGTEEQLKKYGFEMEKRVGPIPPSMGN